MPADSTTALAEARRLLDQAEPQRALETIGHLTTSPDAEMAGQAWLLSGTARYRLDDEAGALSDWQRAADSASSVAWLGWRSAAEQLVRNGDLAAAIDAYREADRRAPPAERPAIASRIAWLLKETGHDFVARREFNRSRGAYASFAPSVTLGLIAVNVIVFVVNGVLGGGFGMVGSGGPLIEAGAVYAPAVASGEWWRLMTAAFLHLGVMHLLFNMWALYLFGPVAEELYGRLEYLVIYLLAALGGSVLTILAAPDQPAVGASGAIFGLLGLAFAVSRRRHLAIPRQIRLILGQAGSLLVLNLIITFAVPGISWTGHVGGLLVGVILGWLLPPSPRFSLAARWEGLSGQLGDGSLAPALRTAIYLVVTSGLVGTAVFAVSNLA